MQYRKLPVKKLKTAKSYQRQMNQAMVKKIVKGFVEDAFGVLVVGIRKDGSHWVVDGQTRLAAAKQLGMTSVPCVWFKSSGQEQEAKMFRLVNNHRAVTRLQRTHAMLAEGQPDIVKMNRTIKKCGMQIGFTGTAGYGIIRSIAPVQAMSGEDYLERALTVIGESWDGQDEAVSASILSGFQVFYHKYGEAIDDTRLTQMLSKTTASKIRINGDARRMDGGGRGPAVCEAIRAVYNRNLKSGRLKAE